MDAVRDHINEMFPTAMIFQTTTHEKISHPTYRIAKQSDFAFIGGTNLISSNMNSYNQWKISIIDSLFLNDIILMGVGWWQYQKDANFYTRHLLKSVLNHKIMHSVRDSYTELMLKKAGFQNVINTSCPTMWRLDEKHCLDIPRLKAETVVTTLTDYNKDPANDLAFIHLLHKSYSKVYLWPQGSGDIEYMTQLNLSRICEILPPKLDAYNSILQHQDSIDFIGTRLHAGVRALQTKRRTIILGIDNRAYEKSKDFNITVCPRDDLTLLKKLINSNLETRINLPTKRIEQWKSQFR